MEGIEISDDFPVPTPYEQKFTSAGLGAHVVYFDKKKPMSFKKFQSATQENGNCTENKFWQNVKCPSKKQIKPIYGTDNEMSFFTSAQNVWNLGKLTKNESLIHGIDMDVPGVLTSYVYNGSGFTCFAFHVEDIYAASINVVHEGESKFWYSVPHSEAHKLEAFSKNATRTFKCNFLLRHKNILIPPSVLKANGIKFGRVNIIFYIFYYFEI